MSADCRTALRAIVVRGSSGEYAGIAILKAGEGPSGPFSSGMKISTFKVAPAAEARGIADIILSGAFQRALQLKSELLFLTILPNHEDLARYLELRGFRRDAKNTVRGERVYVADLIHPERAYSINRLAYDLLADEYDRRSHSPGPTQESPEYLSDLLTRKLRPPIRRILELGPGSGSVLSGLATAAEETVAVEISPKMADVGDGPQAALSLSPMSWTWSFAQRHSMASLQGRFCICFPRLKRHVLFKGSLDGLGATVPSLSTPASPTVARS